MQFALLRPAGSNLFKLSGPIMSDNYTLYSKHTQYGCNRCKRATVGISVDCIVQSFSKLSIKEIMDPLYVYILSLLFVITESVKKSKYLLIICFA